MQNVEKRHTHKHTFTSVLVYVEYTKLRNKKTPTILVLLYIFLSFSFLSCIFRMCPSVLQHCFWDCLTHFEYPTYKICIGINNKHLHTKYIINTVARSPYIVYISFIGLDAIVKVIQALWSHKKKCIQYLHVIYRHTYIGQN